jgi:hypothetical protein
MRPAIPQAEAAQSPDRYGGKIRALGQNGELNGNLKSNTQRQHRSRRST